MLRQGHDSLVLKTIAPRQCAAYTLMCCYTWYNWLVNEADARWHVDNKKKNQRYNVCMHTCARVCTCVHIHVWVWVGVRVWMDVWVCKGVWLGERGSALAQLYTCA